MTAGQVGNALVQQENTASAPAPDLLSMVAGLRHSGERWANRPLSQRLAGLRRWRRLLGQNADELAACVTAETGKTRFDALNEVLQVGLFLDNLVTQSPRWLRSRRESPGWLLSKSARVDFLPLGVVGLVTPWNYPVVLTVGPIAQALAAGNAVLLKPSPRVPRTNAVLYSLWRDAFADDSDLLVQVDGGPEVAERVAASRIDKLFVTGSPATGRALYQIAAEQLTPCVLELGGSDAQLVAADASLPRAARAAVWAGLINTGQACIGVERIHVENAVRDSFVALLIDELSRVRWQADVPSEQADIGPLLNTDAAIRMAALVEDAVAHGAKILFGGLTAYRHGEPRFPPTLLVDCPPTCRIATEEIFGPILCLNTVERLEDAVPQINAEGWGLSASIWTRDQRRAARLARSLRVGGVCINDVLLHFATANLPFGGRGASGFGRTHGREGLWEFCQTQAILSDRLGLSREWHWFPYRGKDGWIRRAILFLMG